MNIQPRHNEPLTLSGRDVTAVLGPTNTGKTHLAIERMVAHDSGVIGLPLRLLAREVYGRVAEKVGVKNVALITGEEKIQPAGARYSVCTVEAMPRRTDAAFVAIDEVQLAGDLERGHIFTDRILHLRGRQETLLLGAATMRGILEKLLRGISVVTRPRLSHLAYSGSKKLTRLPRRTAIVAFSADEVYAIAELIRRQRGGAAVVLGALSPRTRNAQVEIYQSGDVDYLVATDAIGMGLNLDVDHVAFAQNRKFDGFQYRELTAAEFGQIAGRAGRHLRDGTFGVTGRVDPLEEELLKKIEGHDFDPIKVLQWRTAEFDFSSLDALTASIETPSPVEGLARALPAVDARALEHISRDEAVRRLAMNRSRVELLWDVCALPDYRRIAPAQHADIIGQIYLDLAKRGAIDEDFMAEQVRRANVTEGDIDTLSHRIAEIRTWTFVSNRPGWLADPAHWQGKTRDIEDRLSDALHERLTKRFVDRRTSVLMRRLRENTMLEAEISPTGEVLVAGHHVGELQGFRFTADPSAGGEDAKAVKAAAQKSLAAEFELRATRFSAAPNGDVALASDGTVRWLGAPVGTLVAGEDALKPRVILLADEQLTGPSRDQVAARAERFVLFQVETFLKPLVDLKGAEGITGIARGIAFQLAEQFGLVNRRDISGDIKSLDGEGRAALRRCGVRFGAYHVFVPTLVKPGPAGLVTLLWALAKDAKDRPGFGDVVHSLASGRTSVVVDSAFDPAFYKLAGYRILGRRAVRVDILERLADLIRPALAWKPGAGARPEGAFDGGAFLVTGAMMSILGANADDIEDILKGLGYRGEPRAAVEVKARIAAIDEAAREAAAKAEAEKVAADAALATEADAARESAAAADVEKTVNEDGATEADTASSASAMAVSSAEQIAELGQEEASSLEAEAGSSVAPEAVASAHPAPDFEIRRDEENEASVAPESKGGDLGTIDGSAVAPEAVGGMGEAPSIGANETASRAAQAGSSVAPEALTEAVALDETVTADIDPPGATGSSTEPGPSDSADAVPMSEASASLTPDLDQGAAAGGEPEPAPKPILLWRPARFEPPLRHRPEFRGRKGAQGEPAARADRVRAQGAPVASVAEPVVEAPARPERDGRRDGHERGKPRFDRSKFKANPSAAPVATPPADAHVPTGRPSRRPEGEGDRRPERRDRKPDRRGEPNAGRPGFQPKPDFQAGTAAPSKPREDRVPDPDSPFAKLAALRDLLKK